MGFALGIDVGTTYSAAAVARAGGVVTVPLAAGSDAVPSVVYVDDDATTLVGEAAERRGRSDPAGVARQFKRRFGDPTPILVRGTPMSPDLLVATVLRWIVGQVTEREGGGPDHVVLTHPATWSEYHREIFRQAARAAGIDHADLLTEPEAAARFYAEQERVPLGATVAVYDLGGGTFDATVLERTADGFEIRGEPQGLPRLGGADFDEAVLGFVLAELAAAGHDLDRDDPEVEQSLGGVRAACTAAKEHLSEDTEAVIRVRLTGIEAEVRITRQQFEDLIRPLVGLTITSLQRAVDGAGLTADELHRVLLVGGSSRVPLVAAEVGRATGRPVAVDAHPKYAIALGAASHAAHAHASGDARTGKRAAVGAGATAASAGSGRRPAIAAVTGRISAATAALRRGTADRGLVRSAGLGALAVAVALVVIVGALVTGLGTGERPQPAEAELLDPVAVPAVVDRTRDEAVRALTRAGLIPRIEYELSDTVPAGTVLGQDPAADVQVEAGQPVTVRLSAGAEGVTVPEVVDKPRAEAIEALRAARLQAQVEFVAPPDGDAARPPDTVVGVDPGPASTVAAGSLVTLRVAHDDPRVEIPDVRGLEAGAAEALLRAAGFDVEVVAQNRPDVPAGIALATRPPWGSQLEANTTVTLVVAVHRSEPAEAPKRTGTSRARSLRIPAVSGRSSAEAIDVLESLGCVVLVERVLSDRPLDEVLSSVPAADTVITPGTAVTLVVSAGAEPVAVPAVVGAARADALATLQAAGFAGAVSFEFTDASPPDQVLATDPPAGAPHARGGTVSLTVARQEPLVPVPAVEGQPVGAAEAQLRGLGFDVAIEGRPDLERAHGTVISSQPGAGAGLGAGTTVTLVVAITPPTVATVQQLLAEAPPEAIAAAAAAAVDAAAGDATREVSEDLLVDRTVGVRPLVTADVTGDGLPEIAPRQPGTGPVLPRPPILVVPDDLVLDLERDRVRIVPGRIRTVPDPGGPIVRRDQLDAPTPSPSVDATPPPTRISPRISPVEPPLTLPRGEIRPPDTSPTVPGTISPRGPAITRDGVIRPPDTTAPPRTLPTIDRVSPTLERVIPTVAPPLTVPPPTRPRLSQLPELPRRLEPDAADRLAPVRPPAGAIEAVPPPGDATG